jgi:hypothetical protein
MAKSEEVVKAAGAAAVGGAAGAGVVAVTGFTAIGPVGIAVGALAGLAFYGISKAFSD